MEDKKISEAESLALITEMISNTRRRMAANSGRPFLIWGYTTVAVSIFEYIVNYLHMDRNWTLGWFAIPLIGWALMFLLCRRSSDIPKNYIDKAISSVWLIFALSTLFAIIFAAGYSTSDAAILALILLLMGMGTAITGLIIRSRVVTIGGIFAMCSTLLFVAGRIYIRQIAGSVDAETIYNYANYQILLFAAIFFVFMVVPGHILNSKCGKSCSKN